ncbi:hypothetical protein FQR65_LT17737 [Abscondita terminalis]|nr:hypothetical protein FQR65_LT17737 [Abscondita terminalis]
MWRHHATPSYPTVPFWENDRFNTPEWEERVKQTYASSTGNGTESTITETIDKALEMQPDRISFYSYAHVPWIKPGQRRFTEMDLPEGESKLRLYKLGKQMIGQEGYEDVGMDHFARPDDELVWPHVRVDYTACLPISDAWTGLAQNVKTVEEYHRLIAEGKLPVVKGHLLTGEDEILRRYILHMMCRGEMEFERGFRLNTKIKERLEPMFLDGLLTMGADNPGNIVMETKYNIGVKETCFHCGDQVEVAGFHLDDHDFCCLGCQTVYQILSSNNLESYYRYNAHPGKSNKTKRVDLSYLDEEEIAAKLLDYKDDQLAIITVYIPVIHCSSCICVTRSGPGFGDTLCSLVFFILIGKWVQQRTYYHISFERDYRSYFPVAVTVISNDGDKPTPIGDLKVGDRILVRNNEIIPADAILLKGQASVDFSFVTGESKEVSKVLGEVVYAGGRQMAEAIELEVVKPVSQSYLTKLWNNESFKAYEKQFDTFIAVYQQIFPL